MADPTIEIPKRAFFKAAEVCEIAQIQPYVLRTWELEFTSLGVARPGGGARIYRRQDVEQVLQIRHLVFTEGLTLSGARRRLEGTISPPPDDVSLEALVAPEVREKLVEIKRGLRSILTILSPAPPGDAPGLPVAVDVPHQEGAAELLPFDSSERAASPAKAPRPGKARTVRLPKRGSRQPKRGS